MNKPEDFEKSENLRSQILKYEIEDFEILDKNLDDCLRELANLIEKYLVIYEREARNSFSIKVHDTYQKFLLATDDLLNLLEKDQQIPKTKKYYLSIVKDNGKHSSSYSITKDKLDKIIEDDFWILQDKNFN